jgi:beta-glucanase (GH16 family)
MKQVYFILFLAAAVSCQVGSWQMVWNDEFNGNTLNMTKWSHEVNCWGGGNNELQCYTARQKNCQVTGGNLVLTAFKESYTGTQAGCTMNQGCTNTLPFTSARIRSLYDPNGSFLHGRFEIRARIPKGVHLWPAFWMLPSDYAYGSWAASGEIDILEARGEEPTIFASTLHYGGVWPNNVYLSSGKMDMKTDLSAGFHVYACEWEDNQMRFYFDQTNVFTLALNRSWCPPGSTNCPYNKAGQPWDKRFHMLLNLAVGGGFFNGYPALTDADVAAWTSPSFYIDYVRVYQRSTVNTATATSASVTMAPATIGSATSGTGSTTSSPTPIVVGSDVVMIARAPTTITANSQFTVTVSYIASVSRDIVVDVLNSQTFAWFGKGIVNVPAGKGTVTVTVNGQNSAPMGTNYQFKAWNVAAGVAGTDNDWTKAIDQDFAVLTVGSSIVYADCV